MRPCPKFMVQIEHERPRRAVSVRVVCFKQLKPTLANLNKRDSFSRIQGRFRTDCPRHLQKASVAGITKWSCLDIFPRKDESAQPFLVFSSLSSRRMTAFILAGVVCPAIGQKKDDHHLNISHLDISNGREVVLPYEWFCPKTTRIYYKSQY